MIDIILIILVILTALLNIMYLKNKQFEKRFDAILLKIANKIFNLQELNIMLDYNDEIEPITDYSQYK